jgi:hypothetical protein
MKGKKKALLEKKMDKLSDKEVPWVEPVRGGEKKYELKEYKERTSDHDLEDINDVWKEEEIKDYEKRISFKKKDEEEDSEQKYDD